MNDTKDIETKPEQSDPVMRQLRETQAERNELKEALVKETARTAECRHFLNDSVHELRRLRRENELLNARVETMELFRTIMAPRVHTERAMGVDLAWQIEKMLTRITDA